MHTGTRHPALAPRLPPGGGAWSGALVNGVVGYGGGGGGGERRKCEWRGRLWRRRRWWRRVTQAPPPRPRPSTTAITAAAAPPSGRRRSTTSTHLPPPPPPQQHTPSTTASIHHQIHTSKHSPTLKTSRKISLNFHNPPKNFSPLLKCLNIKPRPLRSRAPAVDKISPGI